MPVRNPVRSEFTVAGMVCRHCAQAVCAELGGIHGVSTVDVELATGSVTVVADRRIGSDEVTAVLFETGYALAG
jgi:copper chaperone